MTTPWRSWMSEDELNEVMRACEGPWLAPLPEPEVRRQLAWFPDEALIDWFLRGDGFSAGGVTALSLADALAWRRTLLLRDLPAPLSSADRFLPLIRCSAGFLIYDGQARGVALRRTKQVEQYEVALQSPLSLRVLLGERQESQPRVRRADEDEPAWDDEEELDTDTDGPEEVDPQQHLERIAAHHGWKRGLEVATAAARLAAHCDDELLAEWFSFVGASTRTLLGDLKALSLDAALVLRDEFEERATPALRARLHHLRWTPLIELPGRHLLVAWRRGVRLHVFREGQWQPAAWARRQPLEGFFAAVSAWCEPREAPATEDPDALEEALWALGEPLDLDPAPRAGISTDALSGFSPGTAAALERWFSLSLEAGFQQVAHRLTRADELGEGNVIAPILVAEDGLELSVVEGSGVVLRVGDARLPWAPSLTRWVQGLRAEPSVARVHVTRNIVGHYRVELPMLPFELARRLERLDARWDVDEKELAIAPGPETRLELERLRPVLVLDDGTRAALISALDAHREGELAWEALSTTFVFKPLH